jgi:hypothetical protein
MRIRNLLDAHWKFVLKGDPKKEKQPDHYLKKINIPRWQLLYPDFDNEDKNN